MHSEPGTSGFDGSRDSDTAISCHMIDEYDAATAPDPAEWLALEESERMELAIRSHAGRFPDALHHEQGNPIMHGSLHAVVETQIASGEPAAVRQTLERLQSAGLQRHPAVHAIMRELAVGLHGLSDAPFDHAAYEAALARIDPADVVAGALTNPALQAVPHDEHAPRNRAERRAQRKKRGRRPRRRSRRSTRCSSSDDSKKG